MDQESLFAESDLPAASAPKVSKEQLQGMRGQSPTLKELRPLYEVALKYYQEETWRHLSDADVFCIQTSEDDTVSLTCVMGNAGEFRGLMVYRGLSGLLSYWQMATRGDDPKATAFVSLLQDGLLMSFLQIDELDPKILKEAKRVKLDPKGYEEWPVFDRMVGGKQAEPIDAFEAVYLTTVLEQTMHIGTLVRERKIEIIKPESPNGPYMGWGCPVTPNGREWRAGTVTFPHITPLLESGVMHPDIVAALHDALEVKPLDLLVDMSPISRTDPAGGTMLLAVLGGSGFTVNVMTVLPFEARAFFTRFILDSIRMLGAIPETVTLKSEDLAGLVAPTLQDLGIDVMIARSLPEVTAAKRSLTQFLKSGGTAPRRKR